MQNTIGIIKGDVAIQQTGNGFMQNGTGKEQNENIKIKTNKIFIAPVK